MCVWGVYGGCECVGVYGGGVWGVYGGCECVGVYGGCECVGCMVGVNEPSYYGCLSALKSCSTPNSRSTAENNGALLFISQSGGDVTRERVRAGNESLQFRPASCRPFLL